MSCSRRRGRRSRRRRSALEGLGCSVSRSRTFGRRIIRSRSRFRFDERAGGGTMRLTLFVSVCLVAAACKDGYTIADPKGDPTLDTQLRQQLGGWGTVPILPV